ncbi:50s ribosomal protein [Cyclospora cayetanensis]|uniref:Large ribosomal subunit protein uL4m n=1 Tax=Cyclospora cayetanensis TaxID=88456 RepID=A0A1D3D290_9EIME|nr:50s ribosomal protein [Cyclospora cayetanensis]
MLPRLLRIGLAEKINAAATVGPWRFPLRWRGHRRIGGPLTSGLRCMQTRGVAALAATAPVAGSASPVAAEEAAPNASSSVLSGGAETVGDARANSRTHSSSHSTSDGCSSNFDMQTLYRHHWAVPVVGFNTRLVLPVHSFEAWEGEERQPPELIAHGAVSPVSPAAFGDSVPAPAPPSLRVLLSSEVPSEVFGQPLRPDILHQVYWHTRRAIAGWTERMQLYKWEWPGSSRKVRPQTVKTGMARMGWRKACGKYLGVQTHPLRPHDQRNKCNKRLLWRGVEQALSAKFAQEQLVLVQNLCLTSHKTKHCVKHLRRLLVRRATALSRCASSFASAGSDLRLEAVRLPSPCSGTRCHSALLIHEGHEDVNENFRWATAHITGVKRTDVAGVNAYTLLKHRMVIITLKALKQLLFELHQQQQQRLPRYATPDGRPAPPPSPVPGWADEWIEIKTKEREAKFDRQRIRELATKWTWSSEPKGLLKVPRFDPLRGFRVGRFSSEEVPEAGSKYDDLYADEEPLDEDGEDMERLAAALEVGSTVSLLSPCDAFDWRFSVLTLENGSDSVA